MSALRYYPLSRVQTGLNTNGNMFTLDGKPYKGAYYLTYDGKAFSGPNPACGGNELLTPIDQIDPAEGVSRKLGRNRTAALNQNIQDAFVNKPTVGAGGLKQLVPYYPVVLEDDYTRKHFTRYFAKKVNVRGYIMEISYQNWAVMVNDEDPTFEDYEVIDMLWQLVGPRNDQRVSQYQINAGVYDTNKRITEGKAKGFNGLVEYIGGDYTKYARITE